MIWDASDIFTATEILLVNKDHYWGENLKRTGAELAASKDVCDWHETVAKTLSFS